MLIQKADESFTMRGLDQVKHFVNDNVLQQVAWLLDEFRVEANVARPAAGPPRPSRCSLELAPLPIKRYVARVPASNSGDAALEQGGELYSRQYKIPRMCNCLKHQAALSIEAAMQDEDGHLHDLLSGIVDVAQEALTPGPFDELAVERLVRAMTEGDDLMLVMHGHVSIEREIENYIAVSVADSAALKPMKLDYANKVMLAIALGFRKS